MSNDRFTPEPLAADLIHNHNKQEDRLGLDHRHVLRRGLRQARPRHLGIGGGGAAVGRLRVALASLARRASRWRSPSASRSPSGLGVPAATIVERESGRTDPGFVVIDEVIGQWIALLGSPADWRHGLIALVLFRLFDITKPFPVRQLERLPGGWGIVFDDVAAGLYALGVASLLRIWI